MTALTRLFIAAMVAYACPKWLPKVVGEMGNSSSRNRWLSGITGYIETTPYEVRPGYTERATQTSRLGHPYCACCRTMPTAESKSEPHGDQLLFAA